MGSEVVQRSQPRANDGQPRIFVAGYGNVLRGDDAAGWQAAARIEAWGDTLDDAARAGLEVIAGQQPVPEWALALAESDVALFIDALPVQRRSPVEAWSTDGAPVAETDYAPGAPAAPLGVAVRRLGGGGPAGPLIDGHAVGPDGLLAMARTLFGHAPKAFLITIPAERFAFSEDLSPLTAAGVDEAVALVERYIVQGIPVE
jgi:Ni,Fe-hydrogenase maturation factor